MTKFKISFHCGQVSSFAIEEHENKGEALRIWRCNIMDAIAANNALLTIGDVLINPSQITFVVIEELIERADEPAAGATIEAQ